MSYVNLFMTGFGYLMFIYIVICTVADMKFKRQYKQRYTEVRQFERQRDNDPGLH